MARFCEFWFRWLSSSKRNSRSHNWSRKIKWLQLDRELDKLYDNIHCVIQSSIYIIEKGKQTRAHIIILSSIYAMYTQFQNLDWQKKRLFLIFQIFFFFMSYSLICDAPNSKYTAQNKYVCTRLFAFFDVLNWLLNKKKVYIILKLVQFSIQL